MAKNPFVFPITPVSDWIIIEKIEVKSRKQKQAEKSKIILPDIQHTPKNIMEIEKKRAEALYHYGDDDIVLLNSWDDHPNQGIVMAVGKGRYIEDEVKIPVEVKKGDHVYYRGGAGEYVILNKKVYWAIKEYDIFAIRKDNNL